MQDFRWDELRSLFSRHNYIVRIKQLEDGCVVNYPSPLLHGIVCPNPLLTVYTIAHNGIYKTCNIDSIEFFREVPEYAHRFYIVSDVRIDAISLDGHSGLMEYCNLDGDSVDGIADIIPCPSDREKEASLAEIVMEGFDTNFPPKLKLKAHRADVLEGYKAILSLLPNEDQHEQFNHRQINSDGLLEEGLTTPPTVS